MVKVLIVVDYYLPGYKGGGPIRSVANIVDALGDTFDFWILTRDRDLGDQQAYAQVDADQWNNSEKATIYYASPENLTLKGLKAILDTLDYDVLFINSFFSSLSVRIILLHVLGRINKPVIIAPRGEFYEGALKLKLLKKRLYLTLVKTLNWYDSVQWVASTEDEADTIRKIFSNASISVVSNLPPQEFTAPPIGKRTTQNGTRLVFFSRISPKKNLDGALRILAEVKQPLELDIYGTLEDEGYWQQCQQMINALPLHLKVSYKGDLEPAQVITTLAQYHLMLFPTHGENFGHVIWEALYAGVPVLISDQTPWHDLETERVGWEVPLNQPERFVEVIEQFSTMSESELQAMAQRARTYAVNVSRNEDALDAHRRLFLATVNG